VRDHVVGSPERRELVAASFLQLLKGDAQSWYHNLGRTTKDMMALDLDQALYQLKKRFKVDEAEALMQLEKAQFSQSDVRNDKNYR
jgi:hypothetical protein